MKVPPITSKVWSYPLVVGLIVKKSLNESRLVLRMFNPVGLSADIHSGIAMKFKLVIKVHIQTKQRLQNALLLDNVLKLYLELKNLK